MPTPLQECIGTFESGKPKEVYWQNEDFKEINKKQGMELLKDLTAGYSKQQITRSSFKDFG